MSESTLESTSSNDITASEYPEIGELLNETVQDIQDNLMGYVLVGLPQLGVALAGVVVLVGVIVISAVVSAVVGGAIDEDLAGLVFLLGYFLAFLCFTGVMLFTFVVSGAQIRTVFNFQEGNGELSIGAVREQLGQVSAFKLILANVVIGFIAFSGIFLCYFPVFITMIATVVLLGFAFPLVAVHDKGIGEGMSKAYGQAMQNAPWHGIVALLCMVGQQIPFIGFMLVPALYVRAFRAVHGKA